MKKIKVDFDFIQHRKSYRKLEAPAFDLSLKLIHEVFRLRDFKDDKESYPKQFRLYPSPGAISDIEILFINKKDNSIYFYDTKSSEMFLRYRGKLDTVYENLRLLLAEEATISPNVIAIFLNKKYYKQRYGDIYRELMNREVGGALAYLYHVAGCFGMKGCAYGRPLKGLEHFVSNGYESFGGFCFGNEIE